MGQVRARQNQLPVHLAIGFPEGVSIERRQQDLLSLLQRDPTAGVVVVPDDFFTGGQQGAVDGLVDRTQAIEGAHLPTQGCRWAGVLWAQQHIACHAGDDCQGRKQQGQRFPAAGCRAHDLDRAVGVIARAGVRQASHQTNPIQRPRQITLTHSVNELNPAIRAWLGGGRVVSHSSIRR